MRQRLIQRMVGEWGFPKGLLSIEKEMGHCRRTDLICYTREMRSLLLIECKAGTLDEAALRQAFGYNATVKAPFVGLANSVEIKTFWREGEKITSVPFLPLFEELYAISQRL